MIEEWIRRVFAAQQVPEVLVLLSTYGTEEWHREPERVKRDMIIISRGSLDTLRSTINTKPSTA